MELPKGKDAKELQNWIALLPEMEGKKFMINGNHERVLHHYSEEEELIVKTDIRTRRLPKEKIREFLENCFPIDETLKPAVVETGIKPQLFQSLSDTLLENIEKVKSDPAYIPQAQTINNTAKQLIDLARAQVEMVRVANGVK